MDIKEDLNARIYEKNIDINNKKTMGKYYTPDFIIDYIIKNTMSNIDILEKPFVKVIDPSCGAGYFLLAAYDMLENLFKENICKLKEKYSSQIYEIKIDGKSYDLYANDYWKEENIHYHILTHCIYGADIDPFAVKVTKEELKRKKPSFHIENLNIVECDSLIYWEKLDKNLKDDSIEKASLEKLINFWTKKYDFVIGNPPYIGNKNLSLDYKEWLLEEYQDVFKDKSDISFCFFKRIKDILKKGGSCGIISSRYFMESPNGLLLRKYLMDNVKMSQIVDFYGKNVFKGVSVATAIYFFELKNPNEKKYYIDIHKLKEENTKNMKMFDIENMIKNNQFENFKISFKRLNVDRWMIISEESYNIYNKIKNKTEVKLKDIVNSFQGIITGCDSAFVLKHDEILSNKIENKIVKNWIKNKDIKKYSIGKPSLGLIYSDSIKDIEVYPKSIEYISKHRDKLENRRECKKGIRKWYQLQWGREENLFEQEKIIFPYKSNSNKFAIDYDKLYFSADIYGLILKEDYKDKISLEYLIGILNSSVYEFYFKLFGKKMGRSIYDYYPNALLELNIITEDILHSIEEISKEIILKKDCSGKLKQKIDHLVMDYFEFTERERSIIKKGF